MLFKQINKRDFDELAPKMFLILSSNMEIINPKGTILDDDFSIWLKYQNDHFMKKVFIIFEDRRHSGRIIFNIPLLVIIL